MGKKVIENHRVVSEQEMVTEELLQQQNSKGEFLFGTEEETVTQEDMKTVPTSKESIKEDTKTASTSKIREETTTLEKETFMKTVLLTGAASYFDQGVRYFKNKPVNLTNQKAYEQLMKTGLFVCL